MMNSVEKRLLMWASMLLKRRSAAERMRVISRFLESVQIGVEPEENLKFLLELDNHLYGLLGEASVIYGGGVHSKHRHIGYHDFFIGNIKPGERVLDVGSGNGLLCYEIARQVPETRVVGIEMREENVEHARKHCTHPGVSFLLGDVRSDLPEGEFDVVTMSNVLEHVQERVELLQGIVASSSPERFVVRVPWLERDWRVPLKRELGIDYRLDPGHYIEYTQESFRDEVGRAGLSISEMQIRWGELWAVLRLQ